MLSDDESENAVSVAEDCLRNLRILRLQHQINALTELMRSTAEPKARGKALTELAALSKELAHLKQQGR